jgi:hypothetical protein
MWGEYMEKEFSIDLTLRTTKNFQDKAFAEQMIKTMNGRSMFSPTHYDSSEPLKKEFDIAKLDELIETWMNTDVNNLWREKEYASGDFLAKRKKNCNTNYFASWKKNQQAHFNLFSLYSNAGELLKSERSSEFLKHCIDFIKIVEPIHGDIGISNNKDSNPIDLTVRCPELKWMVIFGKPYIELFGRDKLLSVPCYRVHEFNENLIGLQLVESIFEEVPIDVRLSVKKHLGEEAFVEEGKGIRRHKVGLVPQFDFNEVLFDPLKPIKEPQIITRKR